MKDFKNMLKGLTNLESIYSLLELVLETMYRVLSLRLFRGLMLQYPAHIKVMTKKIPNYKKPTVIPAEDYQPVTKLKLATGYITFENKPNWMISFESHEQFLSLHRWNWLLSRISDYPNQGDFSWGMTLVRSWLHQMDIIPKGPASESYTVGERISNICLFGRQTTGTWASLPDDIKDAIKYKTKYLGHRLEYIPGNLTGNHLINNARALLFAGHCCDVRASIEVGRTILQDNLPTIVDKYGFLREGSSHYQFLFTRWLLEIRFVAEENGDLKTINIIKKHLPLMLEACHFFLVKKENGEFQLPLFGDISPDFEPKWLITLHKSKLAQFNSNLGADENIGWAALFKDFRDNPKINWNPPSGKSKKIWCQNDINGWYRLDFFDWVAIWHAENPSGRCIASHAHHDAGSLALFKSGREILIDSGRHEYENSEINNYGQKANAHSTMTIDDFPMLLSRRDHRLHKNYKETWLKVSCDDEGNRCIVTIEHDGFKRIPKDIKMHQRVYEFTENTVRVADSIDGSGRATINTFFQCPHNSNKITLCNSTMDLSKFTKMQFKGTFNPIGGWRFESFGRKEESISNKFEVLAKLPFKQSFLITDEKN